jgi:hypothetical protein|tara:strand:- start:567 stop:881 length:315 start_codon:yes stop_codon:yes gene_type:complete
MGAEEQVLTEEVAQEGGVEGYAGPETGSMLGGKRRKGSRKGSRKSKKGGKKMKKSGKGTKKGTRKGKRPPSKWIMHVKDFCKKTGMKYPDALKSKECKAGYKKQ